MGFAPGQSVECICDLPCPCGHDDTAVEGRIYTVAAILDDGVITLQGVEIPDGHTGWDASRFRPLDESRLTVFRQMLVTPPSKELVDEDLDARIADCERAVREALGF